MQLKILFISIILLFSLKNISAQKLYFREFKPDISNSPEHIYKLLQDKSGFIWLGTEKGLLQFDGINYSYFNTLKSNTVTSLYQDDSGKIWQGYKNGHISYLQHGRNIDFASEEGLPKVAITSIVEDKEKRIWFATYGEGIYYFYKNRLYNINTDDGLADNYTYDLAIDKNGNIWAATDRGISKIHISNGKKMLSNINQNNGLPDNLVTYLDCIGNTLWIGTQSGGYCTYDIIKNKINSAKNNWQWGQINNKQLIATSLFIGTETQGLIQINPQTEQLIHAYNRTEIFGNTKITDQLIDKEGNLWIAGGLENICMSNTNFSLFSLKNFPKIKSIRAVEKFENAYWLGTENGVFIYDRSANKLSRTQFPQLNNANITSFKYIGNTLWIGTLGQGIYIYNLREKWFRHITEEVGLVNDNILSITSGNNKIYIATLGGISITNIGNAYPAFQNLSRKNGLPADYIYQVYEDANNNLWFGTDSKGLIKLSNGKYTVYDENSGLPAKSVISVNGTGNTIWIGAAEEGLYKFDGNKFIKISINQKQKNYNTRSIVVDNIDNILVVHENGIDIINPENNSVKTYREELGLLKSDPELNAWSKEKYYDYDGDFIFAIGKTIVHYIGYKEEILQPQTRIKSVSLFLNPLTENIYQFSYDKNYISFDFIGLWFHNPTEVNYQVKLEGFDLDWVNTKDHFITYPNLPPGRYTFKVRSSATDNFTNASQAEYSFVITPPFWKRAWFYIPLIVLVAAAGYFYIRQREKMLKRDAKIARQNIEYQYETLRSQVNPHFLFNSFNTLAGIIEKDQHRAVEYVEQLSDFFRNLLVYKDKNVITLQEELQLLENYFFIQKKRYGNNLHLEIKTEDKYRNYLLPPLCLQLLTENAIKHNVISKEKPLHITVETIDNNYLRIQNNFQPKAYMEKSAGIGLPNIKSRYSILSKEEIKIYNQEGYFTVEIPLLQA